MTLAVAVVCHDGVVVAADSRTTLRNYRSARVGSDHTHKVFEVGRVAVATWGEAFVLGRSVAHHMVDFAEAEGGKCAHPAAAAERLATWFGDLCDQDLPGEADLAWGMPPLDLGFLVGGHDEFGTGEAWEVNLPARRLELVATTADVGGAAWRGQNDVVHRILRGFDEDLVGRLVVASGYQRQYDEFRLILERCAYRIPYDTINLQDAIDLVVLGIRTTADVQRLSLGPVAFGDEFAWPGVGGPIEVAAVTMRDGVFWVQRTTVRGEGPQ
jgi:hypothetical protein